jgi:hypothetical protein
MSEDEELLAQGRLVKEYRTLSERLVTLRAHGRNMAGVPYAFTADLQDEEYGGRREVKVDGDIVTVTHSTWPGESQRANASGKWPTLAEVVAHVSEIKGAKTRLAALAKELKALGIPIDDKKV